MGEKPLDVPRGTLPVTLLEARIEGRARSAQGAAVAVRLRRGTPVRWVDHRGGPGSDGAMLGIAGIAAATRLARARDYEAADAGFMQPYWDTPCVTYTAGTGAAASSFDAALVRSGGDGGYPVAVGYDAEGNATDVVVSTTQLPWSLLGLPGEPPPEAGRDEPTATASAG